MDFTNGDGFSFQEGARHAHDGWWGGPIHAIVVLLLLAVLVAGGIWLVRRFSAGTSTRAVLPAAAAAGGGADPAVAVLRMRYAKGEVSREDYRHALADLAGASEPGPHDGPFDDTAPTAV